MRIKRILNNNAVVSLDENENEVILLGSGIAFKRKIDDEIPLCSVDKIFSLKKSENKSKFYELISDIPMEYIKLTEEIILMAEEKLEKKLDESLYLLLTDHIHYAVERSKEGQQIRNKMIWEIEHYYPVEYQIGSEAITMINNRLNCHLMQPEAGFIAMHIVNTSSSCSMEEIKNEMKDMKAICKLVSYHFDIQINEDSMNYLRFVTHLKFFIQRVKHKQLLNKIEQSDELFSIICKKYFQSYLCVEKIEKYFLKTYDAEISDEEKMYLVLHIERVVNNI